MELIPKRQAESWASHVLAFVQADDGYRKKHNVSRAAQVRMKSLLDLAMRVDKLLEMVPAGEWGFGPEGFKLVRDAVEDFNSRMASYPSVLLIDFGNNFERPVHFVEKVGSLVHPTNEGVIAHYIFALTDSRLIRNIRMCHCEAWFYASRKNQKSHSARCRRKLHEKTDEFKAKRREYMRNNYELHKKGRVKEK